MTQPAAQMSPSAQEAIVEALTQGLSETAVTTMLAQNFHWNVTGMAFGPLHALFQEIYEDHFVAQDDLAERIKALDGHALGQLSAMLDRSKVDEHDGHADATTMVSALQKAQETLAATLAEAGALAAEHGDTLTEDLCISRGQAHEKFAWMLRAHLR
ncbi:Dps family protein [Rhodophyticola porphyridii]|uniref:DNA starvation/stationary phase protection protein n=1 Tax=Rhodophyticola porphyridii TaxID=1852017 RepID=A0A3L9Y5R8_9RHOB|nr:DNA starvation/stationary phase protection protein [Rhodophyticola porphyridii]RMA41693.1 DNA starvation/stationary phase protection protein [Rhodophyticola porphyridii]